MSDGAGAARNVSWHRARRLAYEAAQPSEPHSLPLAQALGGVLAEPILTLTDLPAFDTVSMDGWAVRGPGPWQITQRVLAGELPKALTAGEAAEVATGAQFPPGADAVLRREDGRCAQDIVTMSSTSPPLPYRKDVRSQGEEAKAGEQVVTSGVIVTPPVIGLAAAAGHDRIVVHERPTVDVIVMGDELLDAGRSGEGRLRDSISPQVAGWLESVGACLGVLTTVADQRRATADAIGGATGNVIITTGGTARGPVDQLHPALEELRASLIVDQVAVRPGHPMVLARLQDGRPLLGLPGNPLAASVGFVSLGWPLIEAIRGLPLTAPSPSPLEGEITAPDNAHRLMPVQRTTNGVTPMLHHGPAMLSGLAAADALAIAPPGGARSGELVDVLPLPWVR